MNKLFCSLGIDLQRMREKKSRCGCKSTNIGALGHELDEGLTFTNPPHG